MNDIRSEFGSILQKNIKNELPKRITSDEGDTDNIFNQNQYNHLKQHDKNEENYNKNNLADNHKVINVKVEKNSNIVEFKNSVSYDNNSSIKTKTVNKKEIRENVKSNVSTSNTQVKKPIKSNK